MQCKFTVREFQRLKIPHEYIDITLNPVAEEAVKSMGHTSLPVVVTQDEQWSGFRVDKIRKMNTHPSEANTHPSEAKGS